MVPAAIVATIAYVLMIPLVNVAFSVLPMLETPWGVLPPAAFVVGLVFVVRDFAQREIGHYILVFMVVGIVLSYLLADPFVATASAAAFAVSELVDYAIYTVTKRPFRERVLWSSVVAVPIDTLVFLFGIGALSFASLFVMTAVKLVAAVAIWGYYRIWLDRERAAFAR